MNEVELPTEDEQPPSPEDRLAQSNWQKFKYEEAPISQGRNVQYAC